MSLLDARDGNGTSQKEVDRAYRRRVLNCAQWEGRRKLGSRHPRQRNSRPHAVSRRQMMETAMVMAIEIAVSRGALRVH